jgi:hypothetical protein
VQPNKALQLTGPQRVPIIVGSLLASTLGASSRRLRQARQLSADPLGSGTWLDF